MGTEIYAQQYRLDGSLQGIKRWYPDGLTVKERMQGRFENIERLIKKHDDEPFLYYNNTEYVHDGPVLAISGNIPDVLCNWLEDKLGWLVVWQEDIECCDNCHKIYFVSDAKFINYESYSFYVCKDCFEKQELYKDIVKEHEEYHSYIKPDHPCLPVCVSVEHVKKMYYTELHEGELYYNGLHKGQNDTPHSVLQSIDSPEEYLYVFPVDELQPFYVSFRVFFRIKR